MTAPLLDIRLTFTGPTLLNYVANDGFETDTSGWSVSAGIQGAGSSITRTTGGSPYMGTAVGRLVTTSTSGSGVKYVMGQTFTSGVTYRFRVYLKTVSGATSLGIRIGSLGTAGDRAVTTFTVTSSWVAYTVDFTPTGNRSDVQVNVYTNTGSAATVDIDDAEVYDVRDDITADVDSITWTHGANFEGGLAAGDCTLTLHNEANTYSDGARRVYPGMALYVRAIYAGVPYGLWYGIVKRGTAEGTSRTFTIFATDIVDSWDRTANDVTRQYFSGTSVKSQRQTILTTMGVGATQRNLSTFEAEADQPLIAYDSSRPLAILATLDASNGTLSFLRFDPSTSVLYVYTTLARNQRSARASSGTISTNITSITADVNEDVNISDQTINATYRGLNEDQNQVEFWCYQDVCDEQYLAGAGLDIFLANGQSLSGVASIPEATNVGIGCAIDAGGAIAFTTNIIGRTTQTWKITATADTTVQRIHGLGIPIVVESDQTVQAGSTSLGWHVIGPDITSDYIPSRAAAEGYAAWITEHVPGLVARYDVTVEALFPAQIANQVGDLITLTPSQVSAASVDVIIRSLATTVGQSGQAWSTQWLLDVAGNPTLSGGFILDTSQLNGSDVLGY